MLEIRHRVDKIFGRYTIRSVEYNGHVKQDGVSVSAGGGTKVKSSRMVNNITELIGDTPAVRIRKLVGVHDAEVYVKLEYFNPSGSVKDRAANNLIVQAELDGLLQPGATIIEPTSGNTGIGLAMNAAAKGYKAILIMPDNMSKERINILKAYGAQVVLTPAAERMPGAIQKALELQRQIPNSYIPQQFENKANPDIHRTTTAVEILEQMEGRLDAFVATSGTGGTITGTGEVLREKLPAIKIYVVEPQGSPVLSGGQPGPHKLVGTSPGFIPTILNTDVYDEIVQVSDEDALNTTRDLASREGILVGPSAGASVWAALQLAKKLGAGKRILCIAPDTGERYLSMDIF
jgi:cysteine synthase A